MRPFHRTPTRLEGLRLAHHFSGSQLQQGLYLALKLAFDTTRSGQCLGWCGVSSTATQAQCIAGDEVKEKREGCCADQPPCNRAGLPKCKF